MNRGSADGTGGSRCTAASFNEAPIHESGKWAASRHIRALSTRFNEAPIHESGKSLARIQGRLFGAGFNEAPIHESGKSSPALNPLPCPMRLQ